MKHIKLDSEEIQRIFPEVYRDFINILRESNSRSKNVEESKINWGLTYGFFNKKARSEKDKLKRRDEVFKSLKMEFDDRLEIEMEKLRVDITMNAKKFSIRDRLNIEGIDLPISLLNETEEDIKLRMLEEQSIEKNEEVIESIPNLSERTLKIAKVINQNRKKLAGVNGTEAQLLPLVDMEESEVVEGMDKDKTSMSYEEKRDLILDKIADKGTSYLTESEKEFLQRKK